MPQDLFDHARERTLAEKAPLAARMRPRTLDEFIGQSRILGPGRLLRRAIQADQLSSLIFFGPPGTGKTTLAQIIANTTSAEFTAINAVLAGVADIRQAVGEARERLAQFGRRTILFVDEVHRFNKSQQDALLPHVENGTVILIGATTENPYFEVNKAVISRSRIFELRSLEEADIKRILQAALADEIRGYGRLRVCLEPEAMAHLAHVANGDARAALNALELAVETTVPEPGGTIRITLAEAEESIQRKAVLYDKDGDAHFDAISAFIKSMRGSDPDAALYWMARMLHAGEDPRFILRRMLIFAAEDVGLADPQALGVVAGAAQAFDYVGLPEGRFHLSEACLYLATAPKSNTTMAFFDALATVEQERQADVPDHLRDASRDAEGFGHGVGYQYPHAYQDHWVAQQYLPDALVGQVFYQPSDQGFEGHLTERVTRLREAQLTALREPGYALPGLDGAADADGATPSEGAGRDWVRRSRGRIATQLQYVREHLFELASVQRQDLVLDANGADGLLVLEAARRSTEGGVWCRVDTGAQATALGDQASLSLRAAAPVTVQGDIAQLPHLLREAAGEASLPVFDVILLRGLLGRRTDKADVLAMLAGLLTTGGRLVLAETVPVRGERLLAGLDWQGAPDGLAEKAAAAEAALYDDPADSLVNWDDNALAGWLTDAGLTLRHRELLRQPVEVALSPALLSRWFGAADEAPGRLGTLLGEDAPAVRRHLEAMAGRGPLLRRSTVAVMLAVKGRTAEGLNS